MSTSLLRMLGAPLSFAEHRLIRFSPERLPDKGASPSPEDQSALPFEPFPKEKLAGAARMQQDMLWARRELLKHASQTGGSVIVDEKTGLPIASLPPGQTMDDFVKSFGPNATPPPGAKELKPAELQARYPNWGMERSGDFRSPEKKTKNGPLSQERYRDISKEGPVQMIKGVIKEIDEIKEQVPVLGKVFDKGIDHLKKNIDGETAAALVGLTVLFVLIHKMEQKERDARKRRDDAQVAKIEAETEKLKAETTKLKGMSTSAEIPPYPAESVAFYRKELQGACGKFLKAKGKDEKRAEEVRVEQDPQTKNLTIAISADLQSELMGTAFDRFSFENGFEMHPGPQGRKEWRAVIDKNDSKARGRFQEIIDAVDRERRA